MDRAIQVLIVEDTPEHAAIAMRHLSRARDGRFVAEWVNTLAAGMARLERGGIDVVLLDLRLPDSGPPGTLRTVIEKFPDVPVIVLTSHQDIDLALQALRDGAQDDLPKSDLSEAMLTRSIRYAIERKRLDLKLKHYAEELRRSNKDLQDFASIVAHEIKTPLWVINYSCDLLQRTHREKLDPEALKFLDHASEAVGRARGMINDLLSFARVNSQGAPLEPVDVDEVLRETLGAMRLALEEKGASVTHEPLPRVMADRKQLSQVFQNLLSNALRYHNSEPPRIQVDAKRDGQNGWVFRVRDNGIGIAPGDSERIFGMFQRAAPEHINGSGIGLAICKRIVDRHGGRIWVESQVGRGSTFYFTLNPA